MSCYNFKTCQTIYRKNVTLTLNLGFNNQFTLRSVEQNAPGLSTAINLQSAAIQSGLAYDCNRFDENGICISVGGRYAHANTEVINKDKASFIIAGYKPTHNFHVGAYADQSFNPSVSVTITRSSDSPMWGLFGKWNLSASGNGLGVQASTAFANNKLSIQRVGMDYSEAGQGDTRTTSQGYQVQTSYLQPINKMIKFAPYVGLRYTRINNGAYNENQSATVMYPLSYNAMTQNIVLTLAGLSVSAKLTKKLSGILRTGLQKNLNYKIDNYTGTSQVPGLENFNVDMQKNRNTLAAISTGIFYDTLEYGCLGLNLYWQQQAFVKTNTTTALATYTVSI